METLIFLLISIFLLLGVIAVISILLISPTLARRRLQQQGFTGPTPSFPFGNLPDITSQPRQSGHAGSPEIISHDINAVVFPHFHRWRKSFGNVFVYWLGAEPFLYVADPEFLKKVATGANGKLWGKPEVFRRDRMPMFGRGLVMAEGEEWARHRNIIAPAFSMANLNGAVAVMEEMTAKMVAEWSRRVEAAAVIDVEGDITQNAAEIIARTSFGTSEVKGMRVFEKLKAMQALLFSSGGRHGRRLVGVPFGGLLQLRHRREARQLGREIDGLLAEIIEERRNGGGGRSADLLSFLMEDGSGAGGGRKMSARQLVDECKTFFFGGLETTALAVAWTLLLLATSPQWQAALREEVEEVVGYGDVLLDAAVLMKLTKMDLVFNETLRLYPSAPNAQRQALADVPLARATGTAMIPKGTNMWVDIVAMHHDPVLWGPDACEFRPERFATDPLQGGCRHRLGFLPFGFGGRVCIGRNLTVLEYKVVVATILRRFELTVAPAYRHEPQVLLSLRPANGIQLILKPIKVDDGKSP